MQLQIDRIAKRERVVSEFPGRNQLGRRSLRGALLGGTALAMSLLGSGGAQAQAAFGCNAIGATPLAAAVLPVANFAANLSNSIVTSITTLNTAFLTQNSAFIGSPPNPVAGQPGAGIWVRGVGGRADVDSRVTGAFNLPGFPPGAFACNTSTRNDFAGLQVGHDIARLNLGGFNAHVGVTTGYSETENRTGLVEARFQVPFAGLYGAVTHTSGFFVDAQVRGDFYHMVLSDPANLLANQRLDALGFGATASTGHNFTFGNSVIQPSAGVVYARASVDQLRAFSPGLAFTMQLDDIESVLGRIGVLVGHSFTAATFTFQPFVVANFWHEFAAPATGTFAIPLVGFTATGAATRLGSFGQISFGASAQVTDTGWLGYGRVDFRKGDNIESVTVNGGIRYQFSPPGVRAVTARN